MEKVNQRMFTTSRGFVYSYYRGEPSNKTLETLDFLPILLFLHGFLTSSLIWKHQIKYFREQGFVVIAPDLLGLGGTSKPLNPEAYRASLICQDLIELLDAENISNEQVIAVGHDQLRAFLDFMVDVSSGCSSRGSRILSRLANLHPDRCRAYAFLADPYYPPRPMTNLDLSIFAVSTTSF